VRAIIANQDASTTKSAMPSPALRVLAIGAHPDDVEIYCLGLLLKLQSRGWQIGWIVATDGQAGLADAMSVDQRRKEACNAGAKVGVAPILLGLEDGQLSGSERELKLLREGIQQFAPNLIISHAPNDYHPDHRVLSQMTTQICPVACALIYTDTMCGVDFLPEFSVDISDVFDEKMTVLAEHVSQNPTPFMEKIATWNRFRAMQTAKRGLQYAESYRAVRAMGRPSVPALLQELML
jgi:N-acetylglucosamine malate deacetylase 1